MKKMFLIVLLIALHIPQLGYSSIPPTYSRDCSIIEIGKKYCKEFVTYFPELVGDGPLTHLLAEGPEKNGKKDGLWIYQYDQTDGDDYFPNTGHYAYQSKGNYKDGIKDGIWRIYFRDSLRREEEHKNGNMRMKNI